MKKSVIVLVLVVLLNINLVYAYYQMTGQTSGGTAKALPDLIITKIDVPDELPAGSRIEGFQVSIKNIGEGSVDSTAELLVKMKSPTMPSCQEKVRLGTGTGTSANPRFESSSRRNRGGYFLAPGKEDVVYVNFGVLGSGRETAGAAICTQPLREYVNITAEINPKGGRSYGSSQGMVLESDDSNNVFNKNIHVGFDVIADTLTLKLVAGLNAFSVPLITNTTVEELSLKSGCNIFKLPFTKESYGNRRSFDTSKIVPAPLSEVLDPLTPYFADCKYFSTHITLKGKDPGAFNLEINPKSVTFLPVRSGMIGNQLKDYLQGCSDVFFGTTGFYSYVTVYNTYNRNSIGKKLISERRESTNTLVPGIFYFVYCDSSYGGVWDPDLYEVASKRAQLLGEEIDDDYVPVLQSRRALQGFESNKNYPGHIYEPIGSSSYRYGVGGVGHYYYSPVRLTSYNTYSS